MRQINRILCPVDLSDVSQQAIDHAVVMARWYTATITALHVTNPIVIPSTDFAVVGYGPSLTNRHFAVPEYRREVESECGGKLQALDAMLFGSTTNQVVRGATCPVLTLR